jgi:hypothetical protein
MAKVVISDKKSGIAKSFKNLNYLESRVLEQKNNVEVLKKENIVKDIKTTGYAEIKLSEYLNNASFISKLPFRVKFANIVVPGYSSNNVPPIGIAIIGLNNYIL